MEINLVGGSYKNKYIAVNPQRTINWYIQRDSLPDEDSKYKQALIPTPGYTLFATSGYTNARKVFTARTITYTRCFTVCQNQFIELFADGTKNVIGQLALIPNDDSSVFFTVNSNDQVGIWNFTASYCFDMSTDTLTQITDGDFPNGVTYADFTEDYNIITANGRVYYNLSDILTWNASEVFSVPASANKILAAVVYKDNLHCFGQESVNVYINDGTNPFSKQFQSTFPMGLFSVRTLQVFHDGIIFAGITRKGGVRIYLYNGVEIVPLSVPSISWQINDPTQLQNLTWDAQSVYTWDNWYSLWNSSFANMYSELEYTVLGQVLYYLTVPTMNTTFVYDLELKEWVERQSLSSGQQQMFRGGTLTNFEKMNLWTDIYDGNIYKEDYNVVTETASLNSITRTRITKITSEQKKNLSMYEAEVDCTTGVGLKLTPATTANLNFYYSRDGGNTYSNAITLSTGIAGDYTRRPRVTGLGTARDWVFKVTLTDKADIALNSLLVRGVVDSY